MTCVLSPATSSAALSSLFRKERTEKKYLVGIRIMENRRKRYILLEDRVGYIQERSTLSWSGMKSTPMHLLKGELLECLPDTEQPNDSTRIALAGIDRNNLRLECDTEGITKLTSEDANLRLAISSVVSRYQTFINRKRLDFGRQISPGSPAGTKRRSQGTGHRSQGTGYRAQGTGHRAQVIGHRKRSKNS